MIRLGLAIKIRPGVNRVVLDSTRVLVSTKGQVQDSVVVQTQASIRVQVQITTKAQVDPTAMATQHLPHPAWMLC